MATFLSLVQDLARESGTLAASQVTTVVAPTNPRLDKLVRWVQKAWLNIQNEQRDWLWMQAIADTYYFDDGSNVTTHPMRLTINDTRYSAADLLGNSDANGDALRFDQWWGDGLDEYNLPVYRPWTIYDSTIGQSDEGALTEISYERWRTQYDRGTHDANRPTYYALAPNGDICFGPKPDKAYYVRGEYRKGPKPLEIDADEPDMPSRYHDIITGEAMRLLLLHDGQLQTKQFASADLLELRSELHRDQLPGIGLGGGTIA